MEIERIINGEVITLHLIGSFDSNTAPMVEEQFNSAFDQGARHVVASFEKVDYVSSAGLRILLASTKKLRREGGDLHVCTLNQTTKSVFDISGFSTILKVFASEEEARSAFP
ncbi:STAS domain-containing protein [bacterium]|nr:STAS domain-containing protein [bacterium]